MFWVLVITFVRKLNVANCINVGNNGVQLIALGTCNQFCQPLLMVLNQTEGFFNLDFQCSNQKKRFFSYILELN